jgi:hypothetical protein
MRTFTRRWGSVACVAGLLAAHPLTATAADDEVRESVTTAHAGPVTVREGQLVIVAATNVGRSAVSTRVALLDESGGSLVDEPFEMAPGESRMLRWTAAVTGLVRSAAASPGDPALALRLYIYDAERGAFTSPVVTLPFGHPRPCCPPPRTPATAPYAPVIVAAYQVLANLGPFATTYRVSFHDDAGRVLQAQSITLAPGRSTAVPLTAPAPNGVRGRVEAPEGSTSSFALELRDATGRTTAWLEPDR